MNEESNGDMGIEFRSPEGDAELEQLVEVQRRAWGMSDLEITPTRMMHALHYNGALLLGAFDGERMVGFILGVISTVQGLTDRIDEVAAARLQLYSAMMGVLPEYQHRQIGYRLKLGQRDYALRLGLRLVTWTFDPLESRNAWLNIGKLGAVCHQYLPNFHGEMTGINAGLPSDRFYVEWWVTSNRVSGRVARQRQPLSYESLIGGGAVLINEAEVNEEGLLTPAGAFLQSDNNMLLVEIPANFQQIKSTDMALARHWRMHSATIFQHYFQAGYFVTDFARHVDENGRERSFYMLTYRHP